MSKKSKNKQHKGKMIDPTISTNSEPKSEDPLVRVVDQMVDWNTGLTRPLTNLFVEETRKKLLLEATTDDQLLSIESFCHKYRIARNTFDRLCDKFPELAEAKQIYIEAVAHSLERGFMLRDTPYIPNSAKWILPTYSKKYEDRENKIAALNRAQEQEAKSITVVMDAIPDSPLVPKMRHNEQREMQEDE